MTKTDQITTVGIFNSIIHGILVGTTTRIAFILAPKYIHHLDHE